MRETTIGIVIALSLSAPLALAQEDTKQENATQEDVTQEDVTQENATQKITTKGNTPQNVKPAKDEAAAADSVKNDANGSKDTAAPRPEMTKAAVITKKLTRGEKMELTIRFKVDSDQIKGQAHKQILEISNALKGPQLQGQKIGVQGHTDSDGPDDYNLDLSYRRSVTVVRTLVDTYGIEPSRLDVAGYGESRPIATNETIKGKAANRRVTLINLGSGEKAPQ